MWRLTSLSVLRHTQAPFWLQSTHTSCCPSTPLSTCRCTQIDGWAKCRRTSLPSQTTAFSTCAATERTNAVSSGLLLSNHRTLRLIPDCYSDCQMIDWLIDWNCYSMYRGETHWECTVYSNIQVISVTSNSYIKKINIVMLKKKKFRFTITISKAKERSIHRAAQLYLNSSQYHSQPKAQLRMYYGGKPEGRCVETDVLLRNTFAKQERI